MYNLSTILVSMVAIAVAISVHEFGHAYIFTCFFIITHIIEIIIFAVTPANDTITFPTL